eukprot:TRINITY_DN18649_c0_g1_i1.p1 TRINITY_DN18649_c0_g1~~TRINITY_DN18649_c0_g1_i1.p1  ORF type:complete len:347 (+),score=93.39 TRINITY_DN18649_c0_g1_i1:48-1043(+)
MAASAEEKQLAIFNGSFRIAGKLWRRPGAPPGAAAWRVMAYPGWLDNAGSFDTTAAALVEQGAAKGVTVEVFAVDPPGCGRSEHIPQCVTSNDVEEATVIVAVADVLGWDRYAIMAHSRGAGVAAVSAGAFNHRVTAFMALDSDMSLAGIYPRSAKRTAPQHLRAHWARMDANAQRGPRVFADMEEAVKLSVTNPVFPKSRVTAENIVRRHLGPCPHDPTKLTFTHDVRMYGATQATHITEAAMREYMAEITAPTLLVYATRCHARFAKTKTEAFKKQVRDRHRCIKHFERVEVDGEHHVHSDNAQELVADVLLPFLLRVLPSPQQLRSKL